MKYYDKTIYKTEQNAKIIFIILITFILGFLIGYWIRGFDNNKTNEENTANMVNAVNEINSVNEVSKIEYNIYEGQ